MKLSARERDLVAGRAFLGPGAESKLRQAMSAGAMLRIERKLDEIDDLLGWLSAEASHCDDVTVRRLLEALADPLAALRERFSDEPPPKPAAPPVTKARFTAKQGQYLSFIHHYTKLHRMPPAQADLQRYFKVSAPAVHTMVLTLDRLGLIDREPGRARSIRVRIPATELPKLS